MHRPVPCHLLLPRPSISSLHAVGKSALAIVLAHEWAPRFPDAQIFLDGRSMQPHPPSAEALLEAVLCVLCPDMGRKMPEGIAALRAAYLAQLDGRRVLVVLDNAADTTQAKPLTPPAGCAFIVTSRNSILLGSRAPLLVDRLPDDESAALLRTFVPGLSDADASTLARLCAGLPLALRLAGAHLAFDAASLGGAADVTGYVALLARGGRIDFLDEAAEKAGEETIRSTLRASEVKLLESERDAWHKLCVFSSSFDASAAEAVAGATRALLLRLAERSLVERAGPDHFFCTTFPQSTRSCSSVWMHYLRYGLPTFNITQHCVGVLLSSFLAAELSTAFLSSTVIGRTSNLHLYGCLAESLTMTMRRNSCVLYLR